MKDDIAFIWDEELESVICRAERLTIEEFIDEVSTELEAQGIEVPETMNITKIPMIYTDRDIEADSITPLDGVVIEEYYMLRL